MAWASLAGVRRLVTIADRSSEWPLVAIGNDWSREYYDGPFHVFAAPSNLPAISLVFVQSSTGNTGAANPDDLGGGPTDKYLIYEGLSRVAADAVLGGASSVGHSVFFTITHPELMALRLELGLPRHPAQMVLSNDGNVDLSSKALTTEDVPVFLLAGPRGIQKLSAEVARRPWITMVAIDGDLRGTFARLRRDHGIGRISAVGGRVTATALVDAGLVQDIYLTTSAVDAGEPGTPWYVGQRLPALATIVRKKEAADVSPIVFEHLALVHG
jgi:riboflavin biosynthesis pyrimidine reductase